MENNKASNKGGKGDGAKGDKSGVAKDANKVR